MKDLCTKGDIRRRTERLGLGALLIGLLLFAAAVKAQSASTLIGTWASATIYQETYNGAVEPRVFNVSLTFNADGTYSYSVNQSASPAWKLNVTGAYKSVSLPPNPDVGIGFNVTLIPSKSSFDGNGLSAAQEELELSMLSYEAFPTDVQQTLVATWDTAGRLFLEYGEGGTPSTYTRVSGGGSTSSLSIKNITLSKTAPSTASCTPPPSAASFTISDGTIYLYFEATVTTSDNLSASWVTPDGTVENPQKWNAGSGSMCFTGDQLSLANYSSKLGTWRVVISDNGSQVASTSFTLAQGAGPMITSLTPTTAGAGSVGLLLTVSGSGFVSGAAISANLTRLPTTFVSSGRLTAILSMNLLATPGTLSITVSSGGQVSNAQTFAVAPRATSTLPRVGVLAQVAAGGGWDTQIYLTNSSSSATSTVVSFYANDGSALTFPLTSVQQGDTQNLTSNTLSATIPPDTTLAIDTGAAGGTVLAGWADVHSEGPVTGFAVFRYAPQGLYSGPGITTPWEGTAPLQTSLTSSSVIVPFDNTGGFSTGLALVNLSATNASFIATFFDDNGNPLGSAQTISLNGSGHTSFVLNSTYTFTANLKGLMKVTGTGLTGLGLRASPYGTLTSVPVPIQ